MVPPDRAHYLARHMASDLLPGRYPCTSDPLAFSYASDLGLHHRIRSIHTDFLRSHQNMLAGKRRTACQREPAMLGPLRSTAASSAEPQKPVTVTSSWTEGYRLKRLFLALNQRIIMGRVFDGSCAGLSMLAFKWFGQVQWLFALRALLEL